jgi:predicted ATP-dependent protease
VGEMQNISGVNKKIEEIFTICKSRSLTGEQGVVIPESSITDLVLKDELV